MDYPFFPIFLMLHAHQFADMLTIRDLFHSQMQTQSKDMWMHKSSQVS